ncbi:MAG: winged helix-turn-helix transcriptional regulator [Archaeoglobus sp.]|nr:winged helix-turn-helix transcriptional regulator [Archaeoglobus sp.]
MSSKNNVQKVPELTLQRLVALGDALSNPLRIKILKLLMEKEWYVYEMAKELSISRQLLYLHLKKLEKAGLVESDIRLEENKAKKYYWASDFNFVISNETLKKLEV